jgi:competence ComEA-like helix-hairpin-helix protein
MVAGMAIYTRRQAALILGLVVAAGLGMAIGDWRRSHPEIASELERLDRAPDADAPPSGRSGPSDRRTADGAVIRVRPRAGRTASTTVERAASDATRDATTSGEPSATRRRHRDTPADDLAIDLNRANAAELTRLPGIGHVLAERIVALRDSTGSFAVVDDLRRVGGIGPSKLERIRPHLRVGGPDMAPHTPPRSPHPE